MQDSAVVLPTKNIICMQRFGSVSAKPVAQKRGLGSQISRTPAQFIINVTVIYFEGLLGRMEK